MQFKVGDRVEYTGYETRGWIGLKGEVISIVHASWVKVLFDGQRSYATPFIYNLKLLTPKSIKWL